MCLIIISIPFKTMMMYCLLRAAWERLITKSYWAIQRNPQGGTFNVVSVIETPLLKLYLQAQNSEQPTNPLR